MNHILYPNVLYNNAYIIPYEDLYERGVRGIIFDIDNTLVEHDAPADDKVIKLFKRVHEIGFKTCLISNNHDARVLPFAEAVESDYKCDAAKPSKKGYLDAMEIMGTSVNNTVFIGDQILTDTFGANRVGLYMILVRPIKIDPHFYIRLKRFIEKIVLFFYNLKKRDEPFSLN